MAQEMLMSLGPLWCAALVIIVVSHSCAPSHCQCSKFSVLRMRYLYGFFGSGSGCQFRLGFLGGYGNCTC